MNWQIGEFLNGLHLRMQPNSLAGKSLPLAQMEIGFPLGTLGVRIWYVPNLPRLRLWIPVCRRQYSA